MPLVLWWAIHIAIAALVFFLMEWLLPLFAALIGLSIPANIVTIIALLAALLYLSSWRTLWWKTPAP